MDDRNYIMNKTPLSVQPEVVKYYMHPYLYDSLIFDVTNSSTLWKAYHDTYAIGIVLKSVVGYSITNYRQKDSEIRPGSILSTEPGECNLMKKITHPGSFKILQLNPGLIENSLKVLSYNGIPHVPSFNYFAPVQYFLMEQLFEKIEKGTTRLEVQSYITCIIENHFSYFMENRLKLTNDYCKEKIRKVKDYIVAHCFEDISIDSLSIESGLSKFHLIRTFKKYYGITPHKYHLVVCMKKAQRLLEKGEIVKPLCFTDQSHFIKKFREIVGFTPFQYGAMVNRDMMSL